MTPLAPNRAPLNMRLDAVFALRGMTINDLRQVATRRGLSAKGIRRRLMLRIYRDMVELDGVVRF